MDGPSARASPITILSMIYDDETAALAVMSGDCRVTVTVESAKLCDVEGKDKLRREWDEFDRRYIDYDAEVMDDVENWLLKPIFDIVDQLAPVKRFIHGPRRLADYMNPPTLALDLHDHDMAFQPRLGDRNLALEAQIFPCVKLEATRTARGHDLSSVPRYSSSDLIIDRNHHRSFFEPYEIPRIARTAGPSPPVKMAVKWIRDEESFHCELDILLHIKQHLSGQGLHLPDFLGLLEDPSTRLVHGLLLRYIEHKYQLNMMKDIDSAIRASWAEQISRAVEALHGIGVAWGDAAPHNIIIDDDGRAWVVDFGGGYRPGWVDEDKQGTVEGDLQALPRILREYCSPEGVLQATPHDDRFAGVSVDATAQGDRVQTEDLPAKQG